MGLILTSLDVHKGGDAGLAGRGVEAGLEWELVEASRGEDGIRDRARLLVAKWRVEIIVGTCS